MKYIQKRKKGSVAIEFALLAPILLLIFGGAFDVSRFIFYQNDILEALRSGAQYAMTDTTNITQITNSVKSSTSLSSSSSWSMPTPDCGCTTSMTDSTNLPTTWGVCSTTPCTSYRKYLRIQASYAYAPLIGNMLGVLPSSASYATYLRLQ